MIRKDGVRGWAAATMRSRLGSGASAEMMTWWTDDLMGKATPEACIGYSGAVDKWTSSRSSAKSVHQHWS
jgi:hypothetical protein